MSFLRQRSIFYSVLVSIAFLLLGEAIAHEGGTEATRRNGGPATACKFSQDIEREIVEFLRFAEIAEKHLHGKQLESEERDFLHLYLGQQTKRFSEEFPTLRDKVLLPGDPIREKYGFIDHSTSGIPPGVVQYQKIRLLREYISAIENDSSIKTRYPKLHSSGDDKNWVDIDSKERLSVLHLSNLFSAFTDDWVKRVPELQHLLNFPIPDHDSPQSRDLDQQISVTKKKVQELSRLPHIDGLSRVELEKVVKAHIAELKTLQESDILSKVEKVLSDEQETFFEAWRKAEQTKKIITECEDALRGHIQSLASKRDVEDERFYKLNRIPVDPMKATDSQIGAAFSQLQERRRELGDLKAMNENIPDLVAEHERLAKAKFIEWGTNYTNPTFMSCKDQVMRSYRPDRYTTSSWIMGEANRLCPPEVEKKHAENFQLTVQAIQQQVRGKDLVNFTPKVDRQLRATYGFLHGLESQKDELLECSKQVRPKSCQNLLKELSAEASKLREQNTDYLYTVAAAIKYRECAPFCEVFEPWKAAFRSLEEQLKLAHDTLESVRNQPEKAAAKVPPQFYFVSETNPVETLKATMGPDLKLNYNPGSGFDIRSMQMQGLAAERVPSAIVSRHQSLGTLKQQLSDAYTAQVKEIQAKHFAPIQKIVGDYDKAFPVSERTTTALQQAHSTLTHEIRGEEKLEQAGSRIANALKLGDKSAERRFIQDACSTGDLLLDFVPGAAWAKACSEVLTGNTLCDDSLSNERYASAVFAAATFGLASHARAITQEGTKLLGKFRTLFKSIHGAENVAKFDKAAQSAEEALKGYEALQKRGFKIVSTGRSSEEMYKLSQYLTKNSPEKTQLLFDIAKREKLTTGRMGQVAELLEEGGSKIMTLDDYNSYVVKSGALAGDGTPFSFITTKSGADSVLKESAGSLKELQGRLGITKDWGGKELVRIDFKVKLNMKVKFPSELSSGANDRFIFGVGLPKGDGPEFLIDGVKFPEISKRDLGVFK